MNTEPFVKLPKRVLSVKSLGSTAKLVYAAVVDRIGKNGNSWPGERRIADDIGSTRQAVNRAIKDLDRAGLLIVERGAGPRGSNRYALPTGNDSLPVTKCDMSQNVASTGETSCHVLATKRGHNQTQEPDPVTRPSTIPDDREDRDRVAPSGLFDETGRPTRDMAEGSRTPRSRGPDPTWDAILGIFNLPVVTPAQRSRVGKIVKEMKAMEATPEEIRTRADRYRRAWPSVAFTPEALVKHWGMFAMDQGAGLQVNPARVQARPDKYSGVGIQC